MPTPQLQESEADRIERLKCYFSLRGERDDGFWVECRGLSMLPLFYRGVQVHIDTTTDEFEIGDIVVFHRSNKFIAHRIVGVNRQQRQYRTKGDTLFFFDGPTIREEFLGRVDRIRKGKNEYTLVRKPEIAALSASLGEKAVHRYGWFPGWMKFLYYFSFFIPGSLKIYLQKKNCSRNHWN